MFKRLRRLWEAWKKSLFDSYEPKPTVYKIKGKRYVKVKRFRTSSKSKGPYLK
jgi:hypothetical protein